MAESNVHISLVNIAYNYIVDIVPDDYTLLVLKDCPDSKEKPNRNKDGFYPDVEYCYNSLLVIGEAKTRQDVDTKHSVSQIKSYIEECHSFPGESLLVLSVPETSREIMDAIVSSIQHQLNTDVQYVVLSELDDK